MFSSLEFTLKFDYPAYHITERRNLNSILDNGLISMCGNRSLEVSDTRKAIYFFCHFDLLYDWIELLYKDKAIDELILLRFNLKNRHCYTQDPFMDDYYTRGRIRSDKLDFLCVYENNEIVPYNENIYKNTLKFEKLTDLQKIKKYMY